MDFKWKLLAERGQNPVGFVDVYELIEPHRAIAIIHYLPQYDITKPRIMLTLVLEGRRQNWTDGMIDSIFDLVEKRIKAVAHLKFLQGREPRTIDTQIFTIKEIAGFDYLNHGDYTFVDEHQN